MKTDWKMRGRKLWREWVQPLLVVAIVVSSFRSAVADWNDVPTGSMKPTILDGDRIFVNKLAYDLKVPFTTWRVIEWSRPERGEIVVFYSPADGKRLVKRVVGVAGDQIELRDDRLFVNGEPATYDPLDPKIIDQIAPDQQPHFLFARETIAGKEHPVMITPEYPVPRSFGPVTVPDGRFFMMGDNRDNSLDSRSFGFVERQRIVGRASAVALSVDPDHYYLPRWHRFFRSLP